MAPLVPNGRTQFFPILYEGNGGGQKVGKFVPFDDSSGGTITKSCMFDGSPDYLHKTFSSDGNRKKFTISVWFKRSNLGGQNFITSTGASASNRLHIGLESDNTINVEAKTSGSDDLYLRTSRTFEDTSKWYHLLLAVDSTATSGADSEKAKLYIDGELVTSDDLQSPKYPGDNDNLQWNAGQEHMIGKRTYTSSSEFNGYLAEFNNIDGQALLPANFGETDTSTGRWIPSPVTPYPKTTTTFTVTVVSGNPSNHPYYNVGSTNKFAIDGSTATDDVTLTLIEGATYRFDQSDSSNSGHPLRLSSTANGTHGGGSEYTVGVTTNGTPGSSGAYTEITVAVGAPTLYYYCTNHSAMGWTANTQEQYGTNGFRLQFGTSSAMGDDTSLKENDFDLNSIDATNQTSDSPTQNFATLQGTGGTLSEGNLKLVTGDSARGHHNSTLKPKSGKYYAEFTCNAMGRSEVGVVSTLNVPYSSNTTRLPTTSDESVAGYMYYGYNGQVRYDSSNSYDITYATYTTNDIISIALDLDNHTVQFFKTAYDSSSLSYGSRVSQGTIQLPNSNYTFCMGDGAVGYGGGWTANFGQRSFQHTAPTGFVALQQDNLPQASEGVSGLVWTKNRDANDDHQLYDSLRGKHLRVTTDSTAVEATVLEGVQKFLAGGHSIGSDDAINTSGESFITWNWTGNGGTSVTNDASATGVGSIDSVYQANTAGGFSIVTYTGTGSDGSIAHGLGSKPHWVMSKPRDNSSDGFSVLHNSLGTNFLDLETNALPNTNTVVWDAVPTPTVFNVGSATGTNSSGVKYIAYCWSPIEGFSKFGSYTGNASSTGDGTFVYTGFRPAWLMIKRASGATGNWVIMDSTRSPFNPVATFFNADGKDEVDTSARQTDFLSNGFKLRGNNPATNASATYIYFAFAEHPFVGDGTSPVTAR